MDSSHDGRVSIEDLDPKRTALVMGPLLGLLSAPIVFELTKLAEDGQHSFKLDLIAAIVTILLSVAFMVLIDNYLTYHCHLTKRDQLLRAWQQRSFIQKLFAVFSNDAPPGSAAAGSPNNSSFSFLQADRSFSGEHDQHRRKIDPKYFKPKFIINELMTFWGTTCTVITWGSFYVIGGTIVATERIAQKIKAKRASANPNNSSFNTSFGGFGGSSTNRGAGQNESFLNMSFMSNQNHGDANQEPTSRRHAFKRISSWTKRSYTTIKKKFSRVVTTNAPRLNSLTSPLNTSNMSS